MPFPDYEISTETLNGLVDPVSLTAQVIAAGPYDTNFIGLDTTNADNLCVVVFDARPDAAGQTTVTNTLALHTGAPTVEQSFERFISPDGSTWQLAVDDLGVVTTTKV